MKETHATLSALVLLVAAPLTFFAPTASASAANVALWHMNEGSGTVMHDAAGSNDGTLHSVALGQPGYRKTAYGFNGTSSYVDVPNAAALNPGSAKFSLRLRVNFTATPPQDYDLIRKGLSTTQGGDYKIEIAHSRQALCVIRGSMATATLIAGPQLDDGAWHEIVCSRTPTVVSLEVDGILRKRTVVTTGSISNSSHLFIGAKPGSDFLNGRLDEVTISVG